MRQSNSPPPVFSSSALAGNAIAVASNRRKMDGRPRELLVAGIELNSLIHPSRKKPVLDPDADRASGFAPAHEHCVARLETGRAFSALHTKSQEPWRSP